jgi:hypothetical protein
VLISIPHTGTRTLAKHLGITQFFHVGQNEADFPDDDHIDFPVRDPFDTYVSWVCFEGKGTEFFRRAEIAIDYLEDKNVTYHIIEGLPVLEGLGPSREHPLRHTRDISDIPTEFLEWMLTPKVATFYDRFYKDRWYRCDSLGSTTQAKAKAQDSLHHTYRVA